MKQRTETKMNKLQALFAKRIEAMDTLRQVESDIAEILGDEVEIIEEKREKPRWERKPAEHGKRTGKGEAIQKLDDGTMSAREIATTLEAEGIPCTPLDVYQARSRRKKEEQSEDESEGGSEEPEPLGNPLTRAQHKDVQTAREHDMTSSEIADNMNIPVREVNAVMANGSYEDYLLKRR